MKLKQKIFINLISCFFIFCFSKSHATVYYITSTDSAGGLQFNNAITQANLDSLKDTIYFNIPGVGPFNVNLIYPVPAITKPLLIDGLSQPGNDTTLWLIRLTGNAGFIIRSSHCNFSGLKINRTGNYLGGAITIQNMGLMLDSINLEENYIEDFSTAIFIESQNSNSYNSLNNITINDNKFYGNGITAINYSKGLHNFQMRRNLFVNTSAQIEGAKQNLAHKFFITDNTFLNSDLLIEGRLRNVHILRNVFSDQSQLGSNTFISPDSLVISENYFDSTAYGIGLNITDTANYKLYIEKNIFFQNNSGLGIGLDYGYPATLDGLYIRNNSFNNDSSYSIEIHNYFYLYNFDNYLHQVKIDSNNFVLGYGIEFVDDGSATNMADLEISSNNFDSDSASHPLIVLNCPDGGKIDSVFIHNNTLNGGGILLQAESSYNFYDSTELRNVLIFNNQIRNAHYPWNYGAIGIVTSRASIRNISITGNDISFSRFGIVLKPESGPGPDTIKNITISNNQIYENDSSGIVVDINLGGSTTEVIDSINITQNNIYSNHSDGIQIRNGMVIPSKSHTTSNIKINQNSIHSNSGNGISFTVLGDNLPYLSGPYFHHLTYSQDSIFQNGLLGINIQNFSDSLFPLTPIFPFPVLTNLTPGAGTFTINGYLQADSNQTYTLEFFKNTIPDPSGSGEGESYIGSANVTTNAAGYISFQFPVTGLPGNYYFTSTATNDSTGNTSIFSNDVDITTGINQLTFGSFQISPNPSFGKFTIQSPKEKISQITITNLSGQTIFKKDIENNFNSPIEIDLTNQAKGLYLIQVITDKEVYNQKIILN